MAGSRVQCRANSEDIAGYRRPMSEPIGAVPRPVAVIFDLDGTLVDTVEARITAWLTVFDAAVSYTHLTLPTIYSV